MSSPTYHLVVVRPFGSYAKGALITDPKEIARVLASEHANKVVRVAGART
jgi:hypothetical protein